MRAKSIVMFERLFLGSLILGVLNSVLGWDHSVAMLAADPNTANYGPGYLIFVMAFTWVISILLWYFIARRASNIAKWIFVVLFGIGLLMIPFTVLQNPPLVIGIIFVMSIMQAFAIYFLFRPDSAEWFETKGQMNSLEKTFE